mgnify:CR=1 FL=1
MTAAISSDRVRFKLEIGPGVNKVKFCGTSSPVLGGPDPSLKRGDGPIKGVWIRETGSVDIISVTASVAAIFEMYALREGETEYTYIKSGQFTMTPGETYTIFISLEEGVFSSVIYGMEMRRAPLGIRPEQLARARTLASLPFDPTSNDYVQRVNEFVLGIRPSFESRELNCLLMEFRELWQSEKSVENTDRLTLLGSKICEIMYRD